MNLKDYLLVSGVVLALFVSFVGMSNPEPVNEDSIVQKAIRSFGAVSGPDRSFDCESRNGVVECFTRKGFNTATTTPLAVRAPISATSTLALGSGCHFTLASSSAKAIRFAKATTGFATTTFLFGANASAGAAASVVATTTSDDFRFAPGAYLVMSLVGGSGTDSPTGNCSVTFTQI